jgi:hypothetical protein
MLLAVLAAVGTAQVSAQPGRGAGPACNADDGYICGQRGPEDLMAMGPDWAVASAYSQPGGVSLISVSDGMSYTAYPSDTARHEPDAATYPDCPGPPDTSNFTTHGVYVAPGAGPEHKLFVVAHGARESIEIFDVDTRGALPSVTWIGCVIAPDPIGLNSVRALPDGGFLTTNFLPRGMPMQSVMTGEPNGELWEWHTDTGWVEIPGSEASGANGVELSDDGETLYIAAWGSQSFIRLSRGKTPVQREEIDLGFRIDNIHWANDGRLISAGQVNQDWQILMIDPDTLETEQIFQQAAMPGFQGGTVALEVGDEIWVGSYTGDRIAIIPAP